MYVDKQIWLKMFASEDNDINTVSRTQNLTRKSPGTNSEPCADPPKAEYSIYSELHLPGQLTKKKLT